MAQQNFIPQGGYFNWEQGLIGGAVLGNSSKFYSDLYNYYSPYVQQPILVDISPGMLMKIATNVPHLNVVISKLCSMLTQMKIKHCDKNGEEIENSDVIKLLQNPNPMQSLEGFIYDYGLNHWIYNCEFIFKNYATNSRLISPLPKVMWVLPSGLMRVNMTGKLYRQFNLNEIIENYTMLYDPQPFTTDEIIFLSEAFSINGIVSKSKIETLQIPLSNIIAALKLFNVIASEGRMIGAISPDNTGSNENTPPSTATMERMQRDYNQRYSPDGIQGHIGFPSTSIKWQPFEFDVQKLMLFEGLEDAFTQICAGLGADRAIFPNSPMITRGLTTGLEKNEGLRITYQNTIQAVADKLMNVFAKHFMLDQRGEKLYADYSHLPCMQQDALVTAQANYTDTQRFSLLKKDGIIDAEHYAEMADVELTGDGETLQPPAPQLPPGNEKD